LALTPGLNGIGTARFGESLLTQFVDVEHRGAETGVDIALLKSRAEFRDKLTNITGRGAWGSRLRRRSPNPGPIFAQAKIGTEHQVNGGMVNPITYQLLNIEERHRIDHRIAVSAGGGEQAVDLLPLVEIG